MAHCTCSSSCRKPGGWTPFLPTHLAWVLLAGTPQKHLIGTTGHTLGLSMSWLLLMSSTDSLQPKLPSQPLLLVSHLRRTWHSATPAFSRRPPPISIRTWLDPLGHLSLTSIFMYSSTLIPVILWAVTFQSSIRGHSHGPRFLLLHFCSRKSRTTGSSPFQRDEWASMSWQDPGDSSVSFRFYLLPFS